MEVEDGIVVTRGGGRWRGGGVGAGVQAVVL